MEKSVLYSLSGYYENKLFITIFDIWTRILMFLNYLSHKDYT